MILNVQASFLGIDTSCHTDLLQVSLELFHCVLAIDVGSEEFDIQEMANELS